MKLRPAYSVGVRLKLSPLQRISQKTGRRVTECRCQKCKMQCHTPCLGTPQDILRLMDAGYTSRLKPTMWAAGMVMGVIDQPVPLIQPECLDGAFGGVIDLGPKSHCTFQREDGLCELHDLGLKPTEGRLSHHSQRIDNFRPSRSISWAVVQEWLSPENADTVAEVISRYEAWQDAQSGAEMLPRSTSGRLLPTGRKKSISETNP